MPEGFQPQMFLVGRTGFPAGGTPDILGYMRDQAVVEPRFSSPLRDRNRRILPGVPLILDSDNSDERVRRADLQVTWDFAERAANGLRGTFREPYLSFFEQASNADYPHGHEHGRRVERHIEALLPENRTISLPTYLIQAAALFPYLHDADQLNTEQRNADTGESLPPKYMHGLAAGVQILAQTEEYKNAAGISIDEARIVTGAAAYMMIKHEEPAMLLKALAGATDPQTVNQADLTKAYDSNDLDLTRITPAQLIYLLKEKKAQQGFVAKNIPNGLHPLFEDAYKSELEVLAADNSSLLPSNLSENDRKGLHFLTQAVVLADVFDMIMPPEESITRKLGVHKSLNRPFFRSESLEDFMEKVTGESGHFEPEVGSDLLRACWEFMHPLGGIDGELAQSPYVRDLLGESSIKGALAFRNVGLAMMDGDFGPLSQIYDRRIRTLAEKMLGKAKKEDISLVGVPEDDILQKLQDAELSQVRIRSLLAERTRLVTKLTPKFKNSDGNTIYDDDHKREFHTFISLVTKHLQRQYGVNDDKLGEWESELPRGISSSLPFGTYDSSVTNDDYRRRRRTIFEH